ncbi:MAG: hypothetical protein ACRC31_04405, partial [Cetobacterium sp.]
IVMAFSKPFANSFKDSMESLYNFITDPKIVDGIQSYIAYLQTGFDVLKTIVLSLISVLGDMWENVTDVFSHFTESIDNTGVSFQELLGIGANVLTMIVLYVGEALNSFGKLGEVIASLVTGNFEQMKKSSEELKDSFNNMIDPQGMYQKAEEANKGILENFTKTKEEVVRNWGFQDDNDKLADPIPEKSIEKSSQEAVKKAKKEFDTLSEYMKKNFTSVGSSIMSSIGSITNAFVGMKEAAVESTDVFDEQIELINEKYREQIELKKEMQQQNTDSSEAQIEYLEAEYLKQDELGKRAIEIKLADIKAAQKKKDDEIKLKKSEAEEIKKIEKEKEKAIAEAEYQKALVVHQNEVANAQTQHQKVVADAAIGITQGALQGALGFARAFVDLGPIIGPIVGAINLAGVIGTTAAAAGDVKSSASALAGLKGQAPKPPAFQYGTMGYNLESGSSAIVGEAGAEIVTNNDGELQVQSAYQTSQSGDGGSGNVYNISINASQFTMQEIQEMMISILSNNDINDRGILNAY